MTPADWLLVFVAAAPREPVDPIRVQKGMFLLAMEGGLPAGERYDFEPYLYGPMSRAVYRSVRRLVHARLLTEVSAGEARWRLLDATPTGVERATALRASAAGASLAAADRIRGELSAMHFEALLVDVYRRYPEYAGRSVFRRP